MDTMMWYTACLFFEGVCDKPQEEGNLWEERCVLVQGDDAAEVEQRARQIGEAGEHDYTTADGNFLRWHFRKVERVYQLIDDELQDGTEVFSRFLDDSQAASLLQPSVDRIGDQL